jgi:hypothetical protein
MAGNIFQIYRFFASDGLLRLRNITGFVASGEPTFSVLRASAVFSGNVLAAS